MTNEENDGPMLSEASDIYFFIEELLSATKGAAEPRDIFIELIAYTKILCDKYHLSWPDVLLNALKAADGIVTREIEATFELEDGRPN